MSCRPEIGSGPSPPRCASQASLPAQCWSGLASGTHWWGIWGVEDRSQPRAVNGSFCVSPWPELGGTAPTVELQPTAWSQLLDSGNTTSSPGTASLKRAAGVLWLVTCEVPSHPWLDPQLFPVLDDLFSLNYLEKFMLFWLDLIQMILSINPLLK